MAQVHLISGPERRRRWSEEQKRALVAAAFAPGAVVADIARRADVCANQIYRWRRDFRAAESGFVEVVGMTGVGGSPPAIEIELVGREHVRISAGTPPDLAAAVVTALSRR